MLRSADSTGASPTFANPLPGGTEVDIVEVRDAWVRVALADGTRGWLTASVVETRGRTVGATLVVARVGNAGSPDNGTGQARPLRSLFPARRRPGPRGRKLAWNKSATL